MKFCTEQQILNWMNVTWSKMKNYIGQTPSSTERISCFIYVLLWVFVLPSGVMIRWNHLLFCGSQESQWGFRDLWLQWGRALSRTSRRPQAQHWVVDSRSPRRKSSKGKRLATWRYSDGDSLTYSKCSPKTDETILLQIGTSGARRQRHETSNFGF